MTPQESIGGYLLRFNDALEVGLRSRRRILLEASDHLSLGVEGELRAGTGHAEACRRVIAAFGSPTEVASSFHAGLLGGLDHRLVLGTRRARGWMARHRRGALAARIGALVVIAAIVWAVAGFVGAKHPEYGAAGVLSNGLVWMFGGFLHRRRHSQLSLWSPYYLPQFLPYGVTSTWLGLADASDPLLYFPKVMVVLVVFVLAHEYVRRATDRLVERAARRVAPGGAARLEWEAQRPLRTALFAVWSVPLVTLVLVLAYPAPLGLRAGFALLVLTATGLLAAGLCLVRSLDQKGVLARSIERAM